MNKIIAMTAFIAIFVTSAFASPDIGVENYTEPTNTASVQVENQDPLSYRIGFQLGSWTPYLVVGFDLKEIKQNLFVEIVAATPMNAGSAWGGFGLRYDWQRPFGLDINNVQIGGGVVNRIDGGLAWDKWRGYISAGIRLDETETLDWYVYEPSSAWSL